MAGTLRSVQFRREREAGWRRLEELVGRAEKKGLKALSADELFELPQLYRGSLSGLSVARSISLDANVVEYMESLCARAYFVIYAGRQAATKPIQTFFLHRLPSVIRRAWLEIAVAALITLLGTVAGYSLTMQNSNWFYTFVSSQMAQGRSPEASTEDLKAVIDGSKKTTTTPLEIFAVALFAHNAQIGMFAFALGFAFGIPTVWLLFVNGTTLGAFLGLYASRGLGLELGGWLLIHGSTELFAVILCGGAGLAIARSFVFPSLMGRLESLAESGQRAATIVIGAVMMFLVAGLLEGFARQLVSDTTTRYAIACGMLVLWLGYFTLIGRGASNAPVQAQES
jgi:uncharacterized membrane protein SpoIIM required for sporulation